MGILIEALDIGHLGLVLPQAYAAVHTSTLIVDPRPGEFQVTTQYAVWSSHAARLEGKDPVMHNTVQSACPIDSLGNVYTYVYDCLKARYPACTDVLDTVAPQEPAPEPVPGPEAPVV